MSAWSDSPDAPLQAGSLYAVVIGDVTNARRVTVPELDVFLGWKCYLFAVSTTRRVKGGWEVKFSRPELFPTTSFIQVLSQFIFSSSTTHHRRIRHHSYALPLRLSHCRLGGRRIGTVRIIGSAGSSPKSAGLSTSTDQRLVSARQWNHLGAVRDMREVVMK